MKAIQDVWEKYRHVDHLLGDTAWVGGDLRSQMLAECWTAIRAAATACRWIPDWDDEDPGAYRTDCGHVWEFTTGGPAENQATFCPYCGRALVVAKEPA